MKIFKRKQAGQGLMELVVASAVVGIALVGTVSLTVMNISSQRTSEAEISAYNLAREGLEVVRVFRDSGNLAKQTFLNLSIVCGGGNPTQADHTASVEFNPSNNTWCLNFSDVANFSSAQTTIHFDTTNKVFSHDDTIPNPTLFKRMVTIDYICSDSVCAGTNICVEGTTCTGEIIGQKITSEVEWQDKGKQRSTKLVDFLYNWK